MTAQKCPECGAWWAWPSEHRCPPITSTNSASLAPTPTFEVFAHYVAAGGDDDGPPVVSLCGKVWTPSRDPNPQPRCPDCNDLLANEGGWFA